MSGRRRLRAVAALAAGGLLGAGLFAWGFATHWLEIFPFRWIQRAAFRLDVVDPPPVKLEQPAAAASLRALPYLTRSFDPMSHMRGVLRLDRGRAAPGWNFYTSVTTARALLVDLEGRVLKRWSRPTGPWQHAHLFPNGDVLALVKDDRLVKVDLRSRTLWTWEGKVHHDLAIDQGGDIFVLVRGPRRVPEIHPEAKLLLDRVQVLSADGVEKGEIDLFDALRRSRYSFLLPSIGDRSFDSGAGPGEVELDLLHANHVEVFDGRLEGRSPIYARGNLLLSLRQINAILILEPASGQVVWLWGPSNLTVQHHPRLLDNGRILVFNNGAERSEVLEVDPLTDEVVWRYAPEEGFFSRTRGSVQRLPNGNTLITESDSGYVFEITPEGEEVWRFANPDVNDDGERAAIWRMERFPPESLAFRPPGAEPAPDRGAR